MNRPPAVPLLLALGGLVPFLWGAASVLLPGLAEWGTRMFGPRFVGPYLLVFYGAVILSFMGGVLWGFAARAGAPATAYALSVVPALWALFFTGGGAGRAAGFLIAGFAGLLALDLVFARAGLAPGWWLALRLPLTGAACLCLAVAFL